MRIPGRQWCRNKRRTNRASRRPWRRLQHVDVAIALGQAIRERLPLVATGAASVHTQLSLKWKMLGVALDGDYVNSLRLMRVYIDRETEVGRQVTADLMPGVAGVVAAHDVPVLLHKEHSRARRMHRDPVNAMADFGRRIGNVFGPQSLVEVARHVLPASSLRKAPAAEIAMKIRAGSARIREESCASTCRRRLAASAVRSRGRADPRVRPTFVRRRLTGTRQRLQPPHRRCRDRSAMVRDAKLV